MNDFTRKTILMLTYDVLSISTSKLSGTLIWMGGLVESNPSTHICQQPFIFSDFDAFCFDSINHESIDKYLLQMRLFPIIKGSLNGTSVIFFLFHSSVFIF